MTPQEIHIALDLELQKINSFSTKSLEPQEKDYFLNGESLKYVKQRSNPLSNNKGTGFQDTVKRVDDLQELIRTKRSIVQSDSQGENFIVLPSDYMGYISSSLFMKRKCIDDRIKKETYNLYTIHTDLNFPSDTLNNYSVKLLMDGQAITLFDLSMLPSNYLSSTLSFVRQDFLLMDALRILIPKNLKKNNISYTELYWERRGREVNPFTFNLDTYSKDASILIEVNGVNYMHNAVETSIPAVPLNRLPLKRQARLVKEEFLSDIEDSSLSGSTPNSPICVLRNGELIMKVPESVIGDWVQLSYICKPSPINLFLNSGINLNDVTIKEIISNTARYIKAIINDPNYQAYAQENLITE